MSGRSKPPSVQCDIQLSVEPGQAPGCLSALFRLAPAGIHRSIDSCSSMLCSLSLHHCSEQAVSFLCHSRDSRHPRVNEAAHPVGGGTFLSYRNRYYPCYRQSHSPSHIPIYQDWKIAVPLVFMECMIVRCPNGRIYQYAGYVIVKRNFVLLKKRKNYFSVIYIAAFAIFAT